MLGFLLAIKLNGIKKGRCFCTFPSMKELKNIKPLQLDILHIRIAAFRDQNL